MSPSSSLIPRVAYFCMEYALHEELPIYAGGLGVLAGDYIKSAGDLRLPLVAIGLLWSEGYTQQRIGSDGHPYDEYPSTPRDALEPMGVIVSVKIRGEEVPVTAYRLTRYGNAPLYLLEPVEQRHRWITQRLYGGGDADRVAQELLLGVGGVRMLRALGLDVDVYHFNEGHAVFAGLELMRERMAAGASYTRAWAEVREHVVFTTHTPVLAGNEAHRLKLLFEQGADLGTFTEEQLAELGGDPFGMTVAGLRLSRVANAVAQLHGETSRKMWRGVRDSAPIVAVTNGVHPPTWQDARVRVAYADGSLWEAHQNCKRELFALVKERTGRTLPMDRLTIGFARRAAAYKRSDLIFRAPEIVAPLLEGGKIQLLFAGKAHPHDRDGKLIVANLAEMSRRWPERVVFLENYDMRLGRALTRGCDVWLNNPRRPMEASGTSGMKAAMNGVLNLSVLDGWWPEGCEHGVNGWQIGHGVEVEPTEEMTALEREAAQDAHDLAHLVEVLGGEVVPTFYDAQPRWLAMMRASIEMASWRFSSDRMIEEYYERLYRSHGAALHRATG